jgi:NAD(P)-dependent dehydrogenase (short-subunit alcohol dehydrogenase family)
MAVAGMARGAGRLTEAMAAVAEATGVRTLAVPADVTDRASVEAAVARVTEELGNVDLLINNAGLLDAAEVPLWEADPDQWWDVVASHVRGSFLLCRTVVPWMLLRNHGRIINIASGQSVRVVPVFSAYGVAKTGLMRITEALHASLQGSDVKSFDLAPGVVDTPMTRSMSVWQGKTDWTPPERVVEFVAAVAAGELDQWSGRLLRVGADDPAVLRDLQPEDDARRLRLKPYGDDDPLA